MTNQSSKPKPRTARGGRSNRAWWQNWVIWAAAGGALAVLLLGILIWQGQSAPTALVSGLQTFPAPERGHTDGPVTYAQSPPVGGMHNPAWQNCGVYDMPVANENAVHSLEHGAVWITYHPDLTDAEVALLRDLVRGHRYALLSPYPGLPAPIVASAWGLQLRAEEAGDARLAAFLDTYEQGPQTPEPGAICYGGVGRPIEG